MLSTFVATFLLMSPKDGLPPDILVQRQLEPYGFETACPTVSYYGSVFAGRTTAYGDTFDPSEATCASPTLPYGTLLRVRKNGRELDLVVTDTGPFAVGSDGYAEWPLRPHPIRKLDLSEKAFNHLFNGTEQGIGQIEVVDVVFPPEPIPYGTELAVQPVKDTA